jgi:hypothetical protein
MPVLRGKIEFGACPAVGPSLVGDDIRCRYCGKPAPPVAGPRSRRYRLAGKVLGRTHARLPDGRVRGPPWPTTIGTSNGPGPASGPRRTPSARHPASGRPLSRRRTRLPKRCIRPLRPGSRAGLAVTTAPISRQAARRALTARPTATRILTARSATTRSGATARPTSTAPTTSTARTGWSGRRTRAPGRRLRPLGRHRHRVSRVHRVPPRKVARARQLR